jgi:CubicO group peptidase (beta-lactamase class C family)
MRTAAPAARAAPVGVAADAYSNFVDPLVMSEIRKANAPGAVVSIVQGGQLVYAMGYGVQDLASGAAIDAQRSLFRVASISKLFTATAVMQLVEQGELDLHADVNTYLKDVQIPATFGKPITLTHLLTHTSGFDPDQDPNDLTADANTVLPLGTFLARRMPDRIHPPGTVFNYCNYCLALAGYVVQQESGLPFETYIDQHILAPLGMTRSSFRQPPPADLINDVAMGYLPVQGKLVAQTDVYFDDAPDGSLVATAPDMAQFMIAILQDGRLGSQRILRADSVRTMERQHFDAGDGEHRVGLVFFLDSANASASGHDTVSHSGTVPGIQSLLTLVPDAGFGVFVSWTNGNEDPSPIVDAILERYLP